MPLTGDHVTGDPGHTDDHNALDDAIAAEALTREVAVTAEAAARVVADAALTTALGVETAARVAADGAEVVARDAAIVASAGAERTVSEATYVPLDDLTSFGLHLPITYGAVEATAGSTGSMSNGSAVLTDPNAAFPPSCVGQLIVVKPTGYSSSVAGTIVSRDSATQVTLSGTAPTALSDVAYFYGLDATAGFTALTSTLPEGAEVWLSGLYLFAATGPTFSTRCKITGRGTLTTNSTVIGSGFATISTTANGMTEAAAGTVMEDFGVWNLASSTPTAGCGISVTDGTNGRKRNVIVSGFYDCVDYTTTSGRYWVMSDGCQVLDPVRYGLYIHNTTPSGDEGDATVSGGCAFLTWSTRAPVAAVRWESGGGLKFVGNKINQGMTGPRWAKGLDIQVADGVNTGVFLVTGNSIENCTAAGIYVGQLGPANTGNIVKAVITGNEIAPFGASADGVLIQPTSAISFSDFVINDNTIRDYGAGRFGVRVKNLDSWKCEGNQIRGTYHVYVDTGCTNYQIHNRSNNAGGVLVYNAAADNAAWSSQPVEDVRSLASLAAAASTNLWDVTMTGMNSACMVEVTMAGRMISGAGAGPVVRNKRFFISATSGTPVVSAMLTDENATASTLNVTATVAGSTVTLAATHSDAGSTWRGQVALRVTGPVFSVACR